ncbi:MAG TPA: DUF1801 domain-containing protein [Gemmatimonadales bacterium]|nr:DUF1801 domain-containing protein [Gemmatimonadales bacterium]
MPQSKASTVAAYLDEQPPERRAELEKVLRVVRKHMPKGYTEGMGWGMIGWVVPLSVVADTYNGQPLCYAGLAAQKNYFTLHLMSVYMDPGRLEELEQAFTAAGKKLDMGKACIHFKRADDLPLDAIGRIIAGVPMAEFARAAEAARNSRTPGKAKKPGR